jgi:hypothetical protein
MRSCTTLLLVILAGCGPELVPAQPPASTQSFGEKFFTIACQRVAYTSSLRALELAEEAREQDPALALPPVDVSGSRYRLACRLGPEHLPASARADDPKVATLVQNRDPMAEAVNLIFPGAELSDLQDYMVGILPQTDSDAFPALVRQGAAVIGALEKDPALHAALARLDGRIGYRPRKVCLGLMREALQYPELHALLARLIELVSEGGKGHQAFLDVVEALSFELRRAEPVADAADSQRTLRLALELLLRQDPAFGSTPADPMLLVRRDHRGLALVRPDAGKQLPAPFVDKNADGLADADGLGRFVTLGNIAAPAPFRLDQKAPDTAPGRDASGRALDLKGQPLYEYLDLDTTLLAALSRDAVSMVDPKKDDIVQLLLGVSGLMGERRPAARQGKGDEALKYLGFDTAKAPLLDLIHGALQLLRDPDIDPTLEAAQLLLTKHEAPTARLVAAALDASDRGKKHPEAQLDPKSNFYDDLVVVLQKVSATPGLLEDLIRAFADPRTKNLAGMFANYLKHKDVHVLDPSTSKVLNPVYKVPVDRSKVDSGHDRSIQQRLMHIINNTHHMKMCNKEGATIGLDIFGYTLKVAGPYKACELYEIAGGANFYVQSIARLRGSGNALTQTPKARLRLKTENMSGVGGTLLKGVLSTLGEGKVLSMIGGIDGLCHESSSDECHPTTEAVNRLMFMDPLPAMLAKIQDPAIDIDGHQVNQYHVGTLLSWEVRHPQYSCSANDPCQFYDALRPVVQAFADHNAEDLFLDLMSVLHRHFASKQSKTHQYADPLKPDFAWGSGIVSWEPLLVEILEQGDLLGALNAAAGALDTLKLASGKPAKEALARTIGYLVDPVRSKGLSYRDGRTSSLTTDGTKTVPGGVSPFYLLADAFAAKRAALAKLEAGPDKRLAEAWRSSTSDLVDIFLGTEGTPSTKRFKNRRLVPAGVALVDFLRARLKAHASDLDSWLGKTLPQSLEETLSGPIVARAADLLRIVDGEPGVKDALYGAIAFLIDEAKQSSAFRATLTGVADMVQLLLDDADLVPVARALGEAASPKNGLIDAALRFLGPALDADATGAACDTAAECGAEQACVPLAVKRATGASCSADKDCGPGGACSASGECFRARSCSRQTLTRILRNAYQEQTPGKSPVQTLLDLATELHRLRPGEGTPYAGEDFAEAFRQARDFLANEETGLEKFFSIVKSRCGGPCPTTKAP